MKNVLAIATLCGLSLAACTATKPPPAPPEAAIAKSAPVEAAPKAKPETVKPAEAPPKKKAAAETAPKTPVVPKAPAKPATAAASKKEAAVAPKAETVAKAPTPAPAAAPAPAPAAKPAPLDLKSLEQRLKESDAIGVMTKLSLKNQVDDLIDKFRAYHGGERPPTLPQLRPTFELLLMKVLSLLQDKDPKLAHDIDASRDAIWGVLSDRARFAQVN